MTWALMSRSPSVFWGTDSLYARKHERIMPGSNSKGQLCKERRDNVQTGLFIGGSLQGIGFEPDPEAMNTNETKAPA